MQKLNSVPFSLAPKYTSAFCVECRVIVETLLLHLGNNETSKQLGDDLRNAVCPNLPQNMHDGCMDFMNMYAQTVVIMTVAQFSAQKICTGIHACDTEAFIESVSLNELKSFSCDACKEVSRLAEIELGSRHFRKRLIHEAKHFICDKIPSTFRYPCENLTKSYVSVALTRLLQRLQDGELCRIVKAC